ncbi:glycoside hydrolase family 19 protein [Xanthomonas campestris pv. raphani]|uniref:glycoside hydrolase family 19 protein n=1 Tax=Xanthomonas campestris TaxID=339 RepID=UPI002B232933|nr:glycoside hydrolase family 19 protein [Xanthomonas campestris]MEA9755544.1 glycoside hydrolase family 19 protein [Xanthomonas campestris pv. raphani]MEA9959210.1 glycoside hydrolase family 19 protein [Xanthomonas campestris pv. raphani]MEA9961529.1 glycoside hydrolase family 19 protein [Xanthomonas campestris pv. raphani]
MFTDTQLASIMQCSAQRAQRWHGPLLAAANRFGITTKRRAAHWLGQVGHESLSLSRMEEGLTYTTSARLLEVFGARITPAQAPKFLRNPVGLANFVYADRLGNGNEASGDGHSFRGRGPMQHTFRGNYRRIGELIGLPVEEQPDLLLQIEPSALGAAAYWHDNGLNALADTGDVLGLGRKINLGNARAKRLPEGHGDRVTRTKRALQILGVN